MNTRVWGAGAAAEKEIDVTLVSKSNVARPLSFTRVSATPGVSQGEQVNQTQALVLDVAVDGSIPLCSMSLYGYALLPVKLDE